MTPRHILLTRIVRDPRRDELFKALLSGPLSTILLRRANRPRNLAALVEIAAAAAAAETDRYCGEAAAGETAPVRRRRAPPLNVDPSTAPSPPEFSNPNVDPDKNPDTVSQPSSS